MALLQMHVLVHRIGAGSKKPYLPGMDISGFVKAAPPALLMLAAGLLAVCGGGPVLCIWERGMLC